MKQTLLNLYFKRYGFSFFSVNRITTDIVKQVLDDPKDIPLSESQRISLKESFTEDKDLITVLFPIPYQKETPPITKESSLFELTAPFAQLNYYQNIVKQLKKVTRHISEDKGITKSEMRIFCNSQLPEKLFALWGNLGEIGRNNLLINAEIGSALLICGIILPSGSIESSQSQPPRLQLEEPGNICGNCQRCIQACPTSAIHLTKNYDKKNCLQYHSSKIDLPPESIQKNWRNTFYGCQICQQACPYYFETEDGKRNYQQLLELSSPSPLSTITIDQIINMDKSKAVDLLTNVLKKTALGQKWIDKETLYRNIKWIASSIN